MPRKKSQGERVATAEIDETLVLDASIPLSFEERIELRKIFASPIFKKALRNCRHKKPSGGKWGRALLNSPAGAIVANNTLHEMRGWEMFEEALHAQSLDPAAKPTVAVDDYKTPL